MRIEACHFCGGIWVVLGERWATRIPPLDWLQYPYYDLRLFRWARTRRGTDELRSWTGHLLGWSISAPMVPSGWSWWGGAQADSDLGHAGFQGQSLGVYLCVLHVDGGLMKLSCMWFELEPEENGPWGILKGDFNRHKLAQFFCFCAWMQQNNKS